MRRFVRTSVLCAALAAVPSALAGERWHVAAGASTDHVQRGVSQSAGDPAVQFGVVRRFASGAYLGAGAASVSNARTSVRGAAGRYQVDLFAGYALAWDSGWDVDLVLARYAYPDAGSPFDYDYTELTLSAGFGGRVRLMSAYTPDSTVYTRRGLSRERSAWSWELIGEQPLPGGLAALAGAGYHELRGAGGGGYTYFSTGLTRRFGALDAELLYIDTWRGERLYGSALAGSRVVFSVVATF